MRDSRTRACNSVEILKIEREPQPVIDELTEDSAIAWTQAMKGFLQGEFVLVQNLKSDKDIVATSGHSPLNHV